MAVYCQKQTKPTASINLCVMFLMFFFYTIYCIYADDTQSSYIANLNACLYKEIMVIKHFNNERMSMHSLNV